MNNEIHQKRTGALAKTMRKKGLRCVLLEDIKCVYYFSGFSMLFPGVKERGGLLVDAKGKSTLVVSAPLAAGCGSCADEVVPVEHSVVEGQAKRDALFARALKGLTGRSETALNKAGRAVGPDIALMRQCKDAEDKRQLRRLARLARIGYKAAQRQCVSGRSELDLLLAARAACVSANKDDIFVSGGFMSGRRTLLIGGMATAKKLNTGENVVIDLWVIGNHYWSDTCRTFFVDGRSTQKQREILEMLEDVKRRAERAIRPGVKAADIYWQAQGDLKKYGYTCPHHIGHGIGLDFWELPFITSDSTDVFKKDMAFAIEVGVYIEKDLGFRVEDNYFVTETGVRRFTNLT